MISANSSLSFQFSAWVDAVIFVFSLENEASFNAIYAYYTKMSHYRNAAEIPIILVGTQGQSEKVSGRQKHFSSGMPQPLATVYIWLQSPLMAIGFMQIFNALLSRLFS